MNSVPAEDRGQASGHAGHVPERRHGAVDRHLLQPDDRGPGRPPADHDARAPHGRGREARRGRPGRRRAARRQPVRRLPRLQPDADLARASTGSTACRRPTAAEITGKTFFPDLISKPFIDGLRIAFSFSFLLFLHRRLGRRGGWARHETTPRAEPSVSEALEEVAAVVTRQHDVDRARRPRGRRHHPDAAVLRAARARHAGGPLGRRRPPLRARRPRAGRPHPPAPGPPRPRPRADRPGPAGRGPPGELRAEWRSGEPSTARREEILTEAIDINNSLRAQVRARQSALDGFADQLEDKARLYRKVAKELRDLAT